MEEILDKLITEIKLDQRYIDYVEAEKKLHNQEIDSLLHEYQNKLNQYDELKKYNQYIDNQEIKDEIRDLKKKIASNEDILDYLAGNLCRCSGYEGQLRGMKAYIAYLEQGKENS